MKHYYDNTRISDYKKCPRYYYLRHEKNLRGSGVSLPLSFGLAWHAAQDVLWQGYGKVSDTELLQAAAFAFDKTWEGEGLLPYDKMSIDDIDRYSPRTPMIAREMLAEYLENRKPLMDSSTLLFAEKPFAVPLYPDNPDLWYIGRMDKGICNQGTNIILEHKTTTEYKKDGGFRSTYVESWYPSSQCEGYLYSINMEDPAKPFRYVWVDAALVHKKEHHFFKFIPISASFANLDNWLWEARDWVSRIISEHERLATANPDAEVLGAFPKNTDSCSGKYGLCSYLPICRGFNNPSKIQGAPAGFVVEKWEPFNILGLSKLGMENEP